MKNDKNTAGWPYEDIVNLPHHVSGRHTPMPMIKRAAQFAPFAALTGHEDAVAETARLTEDAAQELNREITDALAGGLEIRIVHFVPDEKKAGGSYRETAGKIRKIEMGEIVLEDGQRIPAGDVVKAEHARRSQRRS